MRNKLYGISKRARGAQVPLLSIALVALIAFSMTACDDETDNDTALNGTWVNSEEGVKLVLNNGNLTISIDSQSIDAGDTDVGTNSVYVNMVKGTYTTSGSNLMVTVTHISSAILFLVNPEFPASEIPASQWFSQSELKSIIILSLIASGSTYSEAETKYDEEMGFIINLIFATQTVTYSLKGNTLALTFLGQDPVVFTRQR